MTLLKLTCFTLPEVSTTKATSTVLWHPGKSRANKSPFSSKENVKCKNVNRIYSGHALSFTLSISQFAGMPLKQRKQIFQINVTQLKSQPAGGTPVGNLPSVTEDLNSGLMRNKSRWWKVGALNLGPLDYNTRALKHLAKLPPKNSELIIYVTS